MTAPSAPRRRSRGALATATALMLLGLTIGPAQAGGTARRATPPARPAPAAAAPVVPGVEDFCAALVRRVPGVNAQQCSGARLTDSGARSVRGAPIMVRDVPALTPAPALGAIGVLTASAGAASVALADVGAGRTRDLPAGDGTAPVDGSDTSTVPTAPRRVLVLGAIHGDELTATTLSLSWLAAADQAGPDAFSRRIEWRFVPALNPDGLLASRATRTNARGVDLNRNFPTLDWATLAPRWWNESTRRDPRRFPGPSALSEPESRWVHGEMAAWQPDLIVSIHAPFGVLDFDGPVDPPKRIGRLWLDPVGVYPGSLGNYGGNEKGVPVLTIELAHALKPPTEAEMGVMWRDMLGWIEQRWRPRVAAAPQTGTTPAH